MTNLKDIKIGDIKHLSSERPEGSTQKSVMTLEATVEVEQQPLTKLADFKAMMKAVPPELSDTGQVVFKALCDCFDKSKDVKEGKLGDLIWGFEQAAHPAARTLDGLTNLKEHGYIALQAPDGTYALDFSPKHILKFWVRYTDKLKRLVYVA